MNQQIEDLLVSQNLVKGYCARSYAARQHLKVKKVYCKLDLMAALYATNSFIVMPSSF
jgi:hypothetical protein